MRVLVVNNFFWPRTTGSAHFTEGIAARYAALGHDVVVLTTAYGNAPSEEEHLGYRVIRVPCLNVRPGAIAFNYSIPFALRPATIRKVRRLFDSLQPDIVHQNGQFFDLTFLTTWYATRRRIPRVVTVHTVLTHDRPVLRAIITAVDRSLVRLLNAPGRPTWVTIDKRVDDSVAIRYKPPPARRVFIPVGIEPADFVAGDGISVRERYGLLGQPVILSFGHVIPLRDRVPLIRALPLILERVPEARVLIVGEVFTETFLREARQLGVEHAVVVAGRVEHDVVPDFLAAADVEGHDHTHWGLGITTLEVMAAGVPVFAVLRSDNYPGVDLNRWPNLELLTSGDPSTLAASVLRLLDPTYREAVIADQHEFIRELFTMGAVASRYIQLFSQLVESRKALT